MAGSRAGHHESMEATRKWNWWRLYYKNRTTSSGITEEAIKCNIGSDMRKTRYGAQAFLQSDK